MTPEEVKKLTDEELRVRVAVLCGWKRCEDHSDPFCPCVYFERTVVASSVGHLPRYESDLNAMYEAEGVLVEVQKRKFGNLLLSIVNPDEYYGEYDLVHASARQRAEAFVLTMS